MKAKFRITDPRLALEVSPGELFVPLGPELVECVCAVRSHSTADGVQVDMAATDRLRADALVPVVVVACRVDTDSPEYYPAGYQTWLPGAAPIVFVTPIAPLACVPKEARGWSDQALTAVAADLTGSHRDQALAAVHDRLRNAALNAGREELASRL